MCRNLLDIQHKEDLLSCTTTQLQTQRKVILNPTPSPLFNLNPKPNPEQRAETFQSYNGKAARQNHYLVKDVISGWYVAIGEVAVAEL